MSAEPAGTGAGDQTAAGAPGPGAPGTAGPATPPGARSELADLAARGIDWRFPDEPSSGPAARPAAVLVLFGVLDDAPAGTATPAVARDLDVLLQRRAATLGHHAGQISFPGGRAEPTDAGPEQTALREAVEETGLDPSGVEVLGTLAALPLAASNHLVTPVPAWWTRPSRVAAVDHAETVDVFRVPVADLLDPAHRGSVAHRRDGLTLRTPAFVLDDGLVVWGFTALVLARMFDALGWSVPWDSRRVVPLPTP